MKLGKLLLIAVCVTLISLLYVYQQTEIFRLAYVGQKRLVLFEDLLDKNSILRYNMNRSISLVYLGDNTLKMADFQMPDSYRLVKLVGSTQLQKPAQRASERENIVSRFFSVKRQAEARTINP